MLYTEYAIIYAKYTVIYSKDSGKEKGLLSFNSFCITEIICSCLEYLKLIRQYLLLS